MLHKNAIKYVKQEYTLIFIYYVIRFGIIRFSSVRIPKLRYSVFRYFTRFGPPLKYGTNIDKYCNILLSNYQFRQ